MTTRVGILIVHGIGEQKKFESLEEVARNIATALQADPDLRIRLIINECDSGAYGASQQTWQADGDNEPVIIEVTDAQQQVTELAFNETWWADLGEDDSLQTQLTFWGWGLSLWSREPYVDLKYGTASQMRSPGRGNATSLPITVSDRLRFFWVSLVVLLILPLLSLLSVILRKVLGFELRPDILVQYLGDVKLYQQGKREGKGPLVDLGQPPRISIRRRMVKGLVEMSLRNYDRWYVLSHSLGTLVAFNGLMETEAALPNYLNQDLWEKWQKWQNFSQKKAEIPLTPEAANNMFPRRPAWLQADDIIARSDLFKTLKGVMTYGSPLSKFAVVWPAIVPINKDCSVFSPNFEWINVYDPTDPVADKTKYFNFTTPGKRKQPKEIAYKAEGIHLLSHIEYFTYNPKRKTPLVKQLAYWLLRGDDFQSAPQKNWGWPNESLATFYGWIRIFIWIIIGFLISWILSFLVPLSLPNWIEKAITYGIYLDFSNPLLYLIVAAVLVIIFGIVVRLLKISFN